MEQMTKLTMNDEGTFAFTTKSGTRYIIFNSGGRVTGHRIPRSDSHEPESTPFGLFLGNMDMVFAVRTIFCEVGESCHMDITHFDGLSWIDTTTVMKIEKA